jgi:hypothetical protein
MRNTCLSLLLFATSSAFAASQPRIESPFAWDVQIASAGVACTQGINRARAVTPAPAGTLFHWTIANGVIVSGENDPSVEFVTDDAQQVGWAVLRIDMTSGDQSLAGQGVGNRQVALPIFGPPVITQQPKSVTVQPGDSTVLTIEATNGYVYDWFEGQPGDTSKVVAADTVRFKTPPMTKTTSYWVRVSGTCGPVASNAAVVTVAGRRRSAGR